MDAFSVWFARRRDTSSRSLRRERFLRKSVVGFDELSRTHDRGSVATFGVPISGHCRWDGAKRLYDDASSHLLVHSEHVGFH